MEKQIAASNGTLTNDEIFTDYSKAYDLMLQINPAYQKLLDQFRAEISELQIEKSKKIRILDVGAGTGNFSAIVQEIYPNAEIHFIEPNISMIRKAESKLNPRKLFVHNMDFQQFTEDENTFDIIICIHALYLMKNPKMQIPKFQSLLKNSGILIICDIGKRIGILDWSIYIYGRLLLTQGYRTMKKYINLTKAIKTANTSIQRNQKNGVYWKHNLDQFSTFLKPFFTIKKAFNTYRNHSRFIVATR